MTDVIVHVGFNKCGSTSLQAWLGDNIEALAQLGFAYRRTDPRVDVICSNPQFFELAYHLAGVDRIPKREFAEVSGFDPWVKSSVSSYLDAFTAEYDQWLGQQHGKTVIISNEWLGPYLDSPTLIAGFDTWLKERFETVGYLAYIRSPISWTRSAWAQHCREVGREKVSLLDFINTDMPDRLTSFTRTLPAWEATIGRDRLKLRLFNEDWRETGGMVADFMQACGIPASAMLSAAPHLNASRRDSSSSVHNDAPSDLDLLRSIRTANESSMQWIRNRFFCGSHEFGPWLSEDQKYSLMEG